MGQAIRRLLVKSGALLMITCLMCAAGLPLAPGLSPAARGQEAGWQANPAEDTSTPVQSRQMDVPDIFGGREAVPGAWPWQAALVRAGSENAYNGQICGGSLIAPVWVLTAAHCVDDANAHDIDVVLGRHALSSEEGERIASAEIVVHPNYTPSTLFSFDPDSDIALIRLSRESAQQPVLLYAAQHGDAETNFVGATLTGWGYIENFTLPDMLFEASVPIVSSDVCRAIYGSVVTDNMICAGYPKGYKGPCYGDSGGPLVASRQVGDGWRQIGIVSWGRGCAWPDYYAVYTRVSPFIDWIQGCLIDSASTACLGSDQYEPDNHPDVATLVQTTGISQTHNFHSQQDRDWLKFETQAGSAYVIETQVLAERSDTLLWLYDSDGFSALAYDDDSGQGSAAQLVWIAPRNDIFYVEVQEITGARGDKTVYSAAITELAHIAYLPVTASSAQPELQPQVDEIGASVRTIETE